MIPHLPIFKKFKVLLSYCALRNTEAISPSQNEVKTPTRSVLLMPWAEYNTTCHHITVNVTLNTLQSARIPPALAPRVGQATCTQTQRNLLSFPEPG